MLMSAPTTDAPRERRNSTVVSPMPDETPVHWISMLAVYSRSKSNSNYEYLGADGLRTRDNHNLAFQGG